MQTINVYTAEELKEKYPESFEVAHGRFAESEVQCNQFYADEIMASLKAIFEASGVNLTNWSIGSYSQSHVEFNMPYNEDYNDIHDLEGQRALAWLENNLLGNLRITKKQAKTKEFLSYGRFYRMGKILPCPFTGVYCDEDFIKDLINEVKDGMCLGDSFLALADTAKRLFEQEQECQESEEYFLESAEANEHLYTEDGVQV